MTSSQIVQSILDHAARNRDLVQLIESKGADLDALRLIDLHFRASDQSGAAALALELERAGLQRVVAGQPDDDDANWNVEGQLHASVQQVVQNQFVTRFVRLAAAHRAEFDGWGTSLHDAH